MKKYEIVTLFNEPVLFVNHRIDRAGAELEGLYVYDVRHDDECLGIPCQVKPFVLVNHWGTIISRKPVIKEFIEEDDWNYEDEFLTIEEYKELKTL